MTTPTIPTTPLRDQLVAQAHSLPALVSAAQIEDPALARQLTPKLLLLSRSPPGVLLAFVLSWALGRYGLRLDATAVDLLVGFTVLLSSYVFRYITASPIQGVFRLSKPRRKSDPGDDGAPHGLAPQMLLGALSSGL